MAINESKVLAVRDDGTKVKLPSTDDDFQILERMADTDIVEQLRGKLLPAYVYSFKQPNGDVVVDLTKDGVFAFANLRKGLKLEREWDNFDDKESDEFMCIYRATDLNTGDTREGSATHPKFESNGNKDPYAFAKCTSKGQRNALRHILNVDAWRQLILIFIDEESNKKLAMLKLSIEQNMLKFGHENEQLSQYLGNEYGVSSLNDESLEESALRKVNSFIISSDGIEFFKRPKSEAALENYIINNDLDRKKVNSYVMELKGVGIDGLNSESLDNLKGYLGNQNTGNLDRFRSVVEVELTT